MGIFIKKTPKGGFSDQKSPQKCFDCLFFQFLFLKSLNAIFKNQTKKIVRPVISTFKKKIETFKKANFRTTYEVQCTYVHTLYKKQGTSDETHYNKKS